MGPPFAKNLYLWRSICIEKGWGYESDYFSNYTGLAFAYFYISFWYFLQYRYNVRCFLWALPQITSPSTFSESQFFGYRSKWHWTWLNWHFEFWRPGIILMPWSKEREQTWGLTCTALPSPSLPRDFNLGCSWANVKWSKNRLLGPEEDTPRPAPWGGVTEGLPMRGWSLSELLPAAGFHPLLLQNTATTWDLYTWPNGLHKTRPQSLVLWHWPEPVLPPSLPLPISPFAILSSALDFSARIELHNTSDMPH